MMSGLIVAAGRGTRMGGDIEKIFIELAGKPILAHAWLKLDQCPLIDEVVVVTREENFSKVKSMPNTFGMEKPYQVVEGGAERQDSVWNGLKALSPSATHVAIHDGARPATSPKLIRLVIEAALEHGAAVAASSITDTLKEEDGHGFIGSTLDRTRIRSVQTPQAFKVDLIQKALRLAQDKGRRFTDDTAACELIGQKVKLVEYLASNPKATTVEDLNFIEMLLRSEIPSTE